MKATTTTTPATRRRKAFRFFYTYRRISNDRNGNPVHWINVFQLVSQTKAQKLPGGVLVQLNIAPVAVGYQGKDQAAFEVIAANVPSLASFPHNVTVEHGTIREDRRAVHYSSGFACNYPAHLARDRGANGLPCVFLEEIATP